MRLRSALYRAAREAGDVEAVAHGRIGQRVVNRLAGRLLRRSLRSFWRMGSRGSVPWSLVITVALGLIALGALTPIVAGGGRAASSDQPTVTVVALDHALATCADVWIETPGGQQHVVRGTPRPMLATRGAQAGAEVLGDRCGGPITEDDPRWDCRTMGNRVCGPEAAS